MAYNFLRGDRDQPFLLPPDPRDWLPEGHLAWFILDVTDQLDLDPFLRGYRADGHGHPAYDPKTLLGVLLYAYAVGVRSSRQIERCCHEDLAFRVLAGNQAPDHVTIARFRARHEQALAGFLVASLKLCAAAGLVHLGVIALDGTKVAANAANRANRTLAKLEDEVEQILQEAAEADQAEDRQHGALRGDELPAELASPGQQAGAAARRQGAAGGRGGRTPAPLSAAGRRPGRRGKGKGQAAAGAHQATGP
jgi:transposase